MDTTTSQFSRTSRDSPLPSEPTTTTVRHRAVQLVDGGVAVRVEPDYLQAGIGPILQRPIEIRRARHRHPGGRTRAGAPRHGGDRRRPPLRNQHAVARERGDRSDDRAEVAGVGDVVERHQQRGIRGTGCGREQVVGVSVGVGRNLQRDALMQTVGSDPIQIVARHFEDRDARISRDPDGFGEPLVGLGAQRDVQRGGRHPGAQALDAQGCGPARSRCRRSCGPAGAAAGPWPRAWLRDAWAAYARAGWRRGPRARVCAHRRTRPSAPSWCRVCEPHPDAASFQPSTSYTRRAATIAARRRCR